MTADLLARIRIAQEMGVSDGRELRFVLRVGRGCDPVELHLALERRLGLRFRLTPLFLGPLGATASAELERFYLLRLPGVNEATLGGSPFELAAGLETTPEVERAEPDLETEFFPEPEAAFPGCSTDAEPSPDRGWALRNLRIPQAWELAGVRGAGVGIAQIDTGITTHPELLGALDFSRGYDFLGADADPTDPLEHGPFLNPGHGTATASVAISRGDVVPAPSGSEGGTTGGDITGSAPGATLVPIRAVRSVTRVTQSRVALGIEHARRVGCDVVTMSLGGLGSMALEAAVAEAVDAGLIVMAAAGNCVRQVVFPAAYDLCLAVGGSNIDDGTWRGSCRGPEVDVCAPAENVWRAAVRRSADDPPNAAGGDGEGTSYAVALTAGVAALWLAHHGPGRLRSVARTKSLPLQRLFMHLVKTQARRPQGWDTSNYGAGIVNAEALLRADPAAVTPGELAPAPASTTSPRLMVQRALLPRPGELARETAVPADLDALVPHALEVTWLALKARSAASRRTPLAAERAAGPPQASPALAAVLARPDHGALRGRLGQS